MFSSKNYNIIAVTINNVIIISDSKDIIAYNPYIVVLPPLLFFHCVLSVTWSQLWFKNNIFLDSRAWPHLHNFSTVYCYYYSILLVIVVNLLLWLIYKLNFIMVVHVKENNIGRAWKDQASTGHLGMYPLRRRVDIVCT